MTLESVYASLLRGKVPPDGLDLPSSGWGPAIAFEAALAKGERLVFSDPANAHWRLRLSMARSTLTSLECRDENLFAPCKHVADILDAWRTLAYGGEEVDLSAASKAARERGDADLVIECSVLRALKAETDGRLEDALRHARRASMMARNESLPQSEYLAGIVLARVRRRLAFPHLAIQILRTLEEIASPHWKPWLEWELALAGDERFEDSFLRTVCANPALPTPANLPLFARRDVDAVRSLLDPLKPQPTGNVAAGYASLVGDIHLVCWPTKSARTLGLRGVEMTQVAPLEGKARKRVASLVATLGRESPLDEARCFKAIYGFHFVAEMHRGTFDVLLHRARGALSGYAEIGRHDDQVHMKVLAPFAIPDPRYAERREARLLRILASGGQTARDAAQAAGLSTRQAQALLKELAGDGLCVAERVGRAIFYRVEDTCFSEPTRSG